LEVQFHSLLTSAPDGTLVNAPTWTLYPREKASVDIAEEVRWVSGPLWTNKERNNFRGTHISNFG
jgi:hypothetical protein